MISRLKRWSRSVQGDVLALYLAMRDPRVPWYAKCLAAVVASYALSPIDLIPDFIPVLGYLDDLVLVPLGIVLVVRLIPAPVLRDLRRKAEAELSAGRPRSRAAALAVIAIWISAMLALAVFLLPSPAASRPAAA